MRFRPPSSIFTIFYCSRAMFRSITRSETLAMQAILIVVFATHIKTLTTYWRRQRHAQESVSG